MIPESVIEEIKYRCDINEVISRYVTLKRAGSNMTGLCPFHSEKTPSFTVFSDTRSFYCFGCGAGGDVISFIMRAENLEYPEAVDYLARMAGIEIPEGDFVRREDKGPTKARLLEMNREAAKFFHDRLKESNEAKKYLEKRQLSASLARHFGLGFAPDNFSALTDHMHKAGFSDEELLAGFLCGKSRVNGRNFDYFRNRLMFPIINVSGDVIGFSGRLIKEDLAPDDRKYMNTSDTAVYNKRRNLFALNFAKSSCREQLILCEGNIDVVSLHGAGFTNSVASLGTALTEEQARLMQRYTDEVVITYDNDEAGRRAANKAFALLREAGVPARILVLEDAKDPDDYIKKFGADSFRRLLGSAYSEFDYKFLNVLRSNDMDTDDGRIAASSETVKIISEVYSSVERELYVKKAAAKLGISSESLARDVERAVRARTKKSKRDETDDVKRSVQGLGDRVNPDRIKNLGGTSAEEALLGIIMNVPEFIELFRRGKIELSPDDFVTGLNRRLFEAMLECEGEFDLGRLNESFTPDEVSRAARIQVKRRDLSNTEQALRDCAAALKRSAGKKDRSIEDIINSKRKAKEDHDGKKD